MPESADRDELPQATRVPRRRARISVVWVIPILAAVVAVGIAVQRILSEGPTVTIVFKEARALEAGKTFVKYKDVNIGQVTAVRLSPDYTKVEVTAKIAKSAAGLMVEDARFWIVEPRVTLSGVSGLGTLLSGNYVGFEAGTSDRPRRSYTGLEVPPVVTGGQPGREFVLKAESLGSVGIGTPIYYRRLQAGQVIAYKLAGEGKSVAITIFVNAPYDQYVDRGTRFWNASGLDVSVGAGGVEVHTESLLSILAGGVAFETPPFAVQGVSAAPDTVFTLFDDRAAAMKEPEPTASRYVVFFDETLRGLSVGAPVTLLGLPAGEVTAVGLDFEPKTARLRGRVEIVIFAQRLIARLGRPQVALGESLTRSRQERRDLFQRLIEQRGLRGQLQSGNLLTGQLFVAFDFFPDPAHAVVDWSLDTPVLPTVPSTIIDLQARLTGILAKLENLPYDTIGADAGKALASLDVTLKDASSTLNRLDTSVTPELKTMLVEARGVLATVDGLLKDGLTTTLAGVNTTLGGVNAALEDLRRPLATADTVLKNADASVLGKNAPLQHELHDALQEVALAARSLRELMDYLDRHPEALLRGKTQATP
jgi:paraquat-inducible protein B